jgi:hypothetical protein
MMCRKERQRCWRKRLPSDRRRLAKDRLKYAHTYTFEKMPPGLRGRTPLERQPVSLRANGNLLNNFRPIWVKNAQRRNISVSLTQTSGYFRGVPLRQEGRIAIVTNTRRDVDGVVCGAAPATAENS